MCSRERPLPVEHAGDGVTREAEPVTLGLRHGVLGQLRIAPRHRHGGFPALRVQIQADLPVVFHRRGAGGDQGLAGPVRAAGHLRVAPLVRPPVRHRQRQLLLLVLGEGVGAQDARAVLLRPLMHVDDERPPAGHRGDVEALAGQVAAGGKLGFPALVGGARGAGRMASLDEQRHQEEEEEEAHVARLSVW